MGDVFWAALIGIFGAVIAGLAAWITRRRIRKEIDTRLGHEDINIDVSVPRWIWVLLGIALILIIFAMVGIHIDIDFE